VLTHLLGNLRVHPIETVLIIVASLITFITAAMFYSFQTQPQKEVLATTDQISKIPTPQAEMVYVEIAGAIKKPNVYRVPVGTRLYELITKAGGLSGEADDEYIARNYNLSKLVSDQEKIYIPTKSDIENGLFVEPARRELAYLEEDISENPDEQSDLTVSINTATQDELETLPGIGPVSAQKIVDDRPYATIEELVSKKVVNSATWEKIKELISL